MEATGVAQASAGEPAAAEWGEAGVIRMGYGVTGSSDDAGPAPPAEDDLVADGQQRQVHEFTQLPQQGRIGGTQGASPEAPQGELGVPEPDVEPDAEELRQRTMQTFLEATGSGRLDEALANVKKPKVRLTDGHIGVAGSAEMPTVLEFEGHDERLFVWRYKRAWCVKGAKPKAPPDAAVAPRLLGGAKVPEFGQGEWKEPELQRWRSVATLHADSCSKAGAPRSRSAMPAWGKPQSPTFNEKTVEMGRKMQEPHAGWRPAGVDAAWGESAPAWGSWGAPWGQQPVTRSLSLPTLRRGPPGKDRQKRQRVTTKELGPQNPTGSGPSDKEFRFVANAMNEDILKPEAPVSLEAAIEARKKLGEWKSRKLDLPVAIRDLIGYGDILFEPPDDQSTQPASTTSRPTVSGPTITWEDSDSALGDESRSLLRDISCDTIRLPDIMPKASSGKPTNQAAAPTPHPALVRHESRAAAEKRANRALVQASWKFQHKISPVKVSVEHMFL